MKLNESKCNLMVFGDKSNNVSITFGSAKLIESTEKMLLGVIFDKKLSFKQQVKCLCKKTCQKLHTLYRISNFIDVNEVNNESIHLAPKIKCLACLTKNISTPFS